MESNSQIINFLSSYNFYLSNIFCELLPNSVASVQDKNSGCHLTCHTVISSWSSCPFQNTLMWRIDRVEFHPYSCIGDIQVAFEMLVTV